MKRLNANIRAADGTLQETPEVLQTIRMDRSVNVLLGMVHDFMGVFIQTIVRFQRIGVQFRSRRDVLTNLVMKVMLPACADYRSVDFASLALKQAEHNSLT